MEKSTLKQRARDLRKNSTDAERHLGYHLRVNRLGFKFKRQVPIGAYIVDFVCLEKQVIIERDGGQHMDNQIYDTKRTEWLMTHGFLEPAENYQYRKPYPPKKIDKALSPKRHWRLGFHVPVQGVSIY